jgi:mono/diheme cytochrome c family protein
MDDTLFYVLGIALVVLALVTAFLGLRFEKFPPSRALLIGGVALFAALVIGTTTFAWRNAVDEQDQREEELAADVSANQQAGNVGEAEEEAGGAGAPTTTTAAPAEAALEQGAQVFSSAGCSGCHTLAAAGSSGTTGPDLDGALKGQSPEFIETSIVDPNQSIAKGYPPDVMPQNFGDTLSPEDLDALVQYLGASTSGQGG